MKVLSSRQTEVERTHRQTMFLEGTIDFIIIIIHKCKNYQDFGPIQYQRRVSILFQLLSCSNFHLCMNYGNKLKLLMPQVDFFHFPLCAHMS